MRMIEKGSLRRFKKMGSGGIFRPFVRIKKASVFTLNVHLLWLKMKKANQFVLKE